MLYDFGLSGNPDRFERTSLIHQFDLLIEKSIILDSCTLSVYLDFVHLFGVFC